MRFFHTSHKVVPGYRVASRHPFTRPLQCYFSIHSTILAVQGDSRVKIYWRTQKGLGGFRSCYHLPSENIGPYRMVRQPSGGREDEFDSVRDMTSDNQLSL